MKILKNFLKSIDIFGITFSFRYKNKEHYQTSFGGLIVILFSILVLVVGLYYLIPFANRQNYTIVYYTMNLASTEEVNMFQSYSNFAVGLVCEENENEKLSVYDLLKIKSKYTSFIKQTDGNSFKDSKDLHTHKCSYNDFYNKYNKQVDYLGLSSYECLEEKEDKIQGIYNDQIFSYFEFTVVGRNDSVLDILDTFLIENDCKFTMVYTDIIIDLKNYKTPITQYLNEAFIQLNPNLYTKRDIYFMNQYFTNDNYLLFVFGEDDEKSELKTLYSRYHEYTSYKGFERNKNKIDNYEKYAKIFIRADLKKTIINRKYQKIFEFYADASSILIAIYEIIVIIINFIDNFYAYHSLAKNIFFFKELEEVTHHFDISRKRKDFKGLISIIELDEKNNDLNKYEKNKYFSRNILRNNNEYKDDKLILDNNLRNKDIQINKNVQKIDYINIKINETEENKVKNILKIPKIFNEKNRIKTQHINIDKEYDINSKEYLRKGNISFKQNQIYNNISSKLFNLKGIISNNSIDLNEQNEPKKKDIKRILNSFNLFEIVIAQFLKCCMCQNLSIKNKVNQNANKIINKKLDIITYIRNMFIFDIMNRTILDDDKKNILNFLCRPTISVNESQKNEFEEFYKIYGDKDFDKFTKNIEELIRKPHKHNKEKRLISYSKEHLKEFL